MKNSQQLTENTTIALVNGYFRTHGFFDHNVKSDDFVSIISNYLLEMQLIFSNNNKNINAFDKRNAFHKRNVFDKSDTRVSVIDILDENCFIAGSFVSELLLSNNTVNYS